MKKTFLISLMALFVGATAWGATIKIGGDNPDYSATLANLNAAVAAANAGDLIEVYEDITDNEDYLTISGKTNLTLDFKGHMFYQQNTTAGYGVPGGMIVYINNSQNIVIKNAIFDRETKQPNQNGINLLNGSSVSLENVTVYAFSTITYMGPAANSIVLDEVQLHGVNFGILTNSNANSEVIINSGNIDCSNTTGGVGVEADGGNVVINDVDINGAYRGFQLKGNASAVINGGSIVGPNDAGVKLFNNASIVINGGEISGGTIALEDASENNATIEISGGVFNSPIEESWCTDNYEPINNGDGTYGVVAISFDYTRSVAANSYGTICLPKTGKIVGATLFEIEYKTPGAIYFIETGYDDIIMGRPYVFLSDANVSEIKVAYTNDDVATEAGTYKGLIGSFANKEQIDPSGNYCIIKNNMYYHVNSDNVYVTANHAYINLDAINASAPSNAAPTRRRIAFYESSTTAIDNVEFNNSAKKTMIDGQLIIIRGEQMFNAAGQQVK